MRELTPAWTKDTQDEIDRDLILYEDEKFKRVCSQ